MLTPLQLKLLVFIDGFITRHGYCPSYDEMTGPVKTTKSGVHRIIKALEERGYIERLPHRQRAIRVIRAPTQDRERRIQLLQAVANAARYHVCDDDCALRVAFNELEEFDTRID